MESEKAGDVMRSSIVSLRHSLRRGVAIHSFSTAAVYTKQTNKISRTARVTAVTSSVISSGTDRTRSLALAVVCPLQCHHRSFKLYTQQIAQCRGTSEASWISAICDDRVFDMSLSPFLKTLTQYMPLGQRQVAPAAEQPPTILLRMYAVGA